MKLQKNKLYTFILIFSFYSCVQRPEPVVDPAIEAKAESTQEPNPEALKHFMDAQLYISQNNYPMAIIELQDALRLDPSAGSIHVSLAESFWKLGKINRAEEHLKVAIKLNDKDVDARKMLADQYIIRHQFDEANEQFNELRKIEPEAAEHILAQGELAAARLQWLKAIQFYREAFDIDKSLINALEKAAEISLRSNNLQTAREIYEQLTKIDIRNVEYLSAYADLIIMEERYEEATIIIQKIMEVEGPSKDRMFQSGIIFYQKKQLQQALKFFKEAYKIDAKDANVLHFIATLFLELNQPDSANVYADKLLLQNPKDPRGYINSALAAMNISQFQSAREILLPVVETYPQEYAIQYLLGNIYYLEKNNEEALKYLNRAIKISPNSRNVLHILAIINDTMKFWTESDSLYEKLISSDSTDAQAYNNYAYSLVERDDKLDRALQYATKAIALAPKNAAYLDTYGWILYKLGRHNEALDYIQNSLELEDTNAVVLEHLGDVLKRVKRDNDALEYYRKAYEFDSNNEKLKQKAFPE